MPVVLAVIVNVPGVPFETPLLGEAISQLPPCGLCTLKLDFQLSAPLPRLPIFTVCDGGMLSVVALNVSPEVSTARLAGCAAPTLKVTSMLSVAGVAVG